MTRRGGQLPWGSGSSGPLYGNRRTGPPWGPIRVVAAAAALLIAGIFLFRACVGGGGCTASYCPSGQSIATPDGYERVTRIYDFNTSKGRTPGTQPLNVTLPLDKETTNAADLSFFRYVPETKGWEPLSPALLDGQAVTGVVGPGTTTIAVMRRLSAGGRVVAYVPNNGVLHPEAANRATVVHTIDLRPASDGTLVGELTPLATTKAKTDGSVAHYPVIMGSKADKQFLPIITSILGNATSRSNHAQQITKYVAEHSLAGIDIAYFDLTVNERTSFALFILELGQALKAQSKALTVTMPSPIRTAERVDEDGYDWTEIGKSADFIKIWPLQDQSTFRKDMPVILDQLVAEVPAGKLVLTVSPFSHVKSKDTVEQITYTAAMVRAARISISTSLPDGKLTTGTNVEIVAANIDKTKGRTGISWTPETATVTYTYEELGGHTVWIENAFSTGFKLEFAARYKLGGVAVENATADTNLANIWPAMVPFITTGQPLLLQPNPKDLVPQWKVSKGTASGGERGVMTWSTPTEPGTYTVTLTLSDGVALFENEAEYTVQAKERATPTPAASPTVAR